MLRDYQTNRPGHAHAGTYIAELWGRAEDKLLGQFLGRPGNAKELRKLREHEQAKQNAIHLRPQLEKNATDCRTRYEVAKNAIGSLPDMDFARSLWEWTVANSRNENCAPYLYRVAEPLAVRYFLRLHAVEILKLALADAEKAKNDYQQFLAINADLLAEAEAERKAAEAEAKAEADRLAELERQRREEAARQSPDAINEADAIEQINLRAQHEAHRLAHMGTKPGTTGELA